MTTSNSVELTSKCPCGGTSVPDQDTLFLDWDGSGMIDTNCDQCPTQSVVYLSWEGYEPPDDDEEDDR